VNLLLLDGQAGIDDVQAKFLDLAFVLFDDAALEHAKALLQIISDAAIGAALIKFKSRARAARSLLMARSREMRK
jgi:hypothetical protein